MVPNRVVFCGFQLSGAEVLRDLLSTPEEFEVVEVWTSKDPDVWPDGYASVEELARAKGIPVRVGNPRNSERLRRLPERVDVLLCANYRYILPESIFLRATRGAVNIHGSLLPAYRGRTPNTWAIIHGEEETGATVHLIEATVDTGAILAQARIPIDPYDTGYTLFLKMVKRYPGLVRQAIRNLLDPDFLPVEQDESRASEYPARSPDDGGIQWPLSAWEIYNWIRAQTAPYPGAFTTFHGSRVTVWNAVYTDAVRPDRTGSPGSILGTALSPQSSGLWVATGDRPILLTSVQVGSHAACSPHSLLNRLWRIGDILGS
jgi:methionyl-tRNA formyltransferase